MKFSVIQKSRSLTSGLADTIREQISEGIFKVGEKLPASRCIEKEAGVSRTVVREAIAQLKAEGLVDSRQGFGVFVSSQGKEKSGFEITPLEFADYENVIQILELRMAVEVEMAAMAAAKRSQLQLQNIYQCMTAMEEKIANNIDSLTEDFAFHIAIAEASGNPYFTRFIDFIGAGVIPAREIITQFEDRICNERLFDSIQKEHRRIYEAIDTQDAELAKASVKAHLSNSLKRHREIQRKVGTK